MNKENTKRRKRLFLYSAALLQSFFNWGYICLKLTLNSPPKPHVFVSLPLMSNVFTNWWHIRPMIMDLRMRELKGERLLECDYSRLMSAILPYYFNVVANATWVITPEFNYRENVKPDYTIYFMQNNPFNHLAFVIVEIKSKTSDSWHKLLEQLWSQCDLNKHNNGRIWAIGHNGLDICFFKFDVVSYPYSLPEVFVGFNPLNLSNLTAAQLHQMGAICEFFSNLGVQRIGLIKWRLDNPNHWMYIHNMFTHMKAQSP